MVERGIQWNEDFITGIEVMDYHHEGMLEKIKELFDVMDKGQEIASIKALAIIFESFLVSHFTLEEMLQQKFSYPDFSSHSNQHRWLSDYFSDLISLIDSKSTSPDFVTVTRNFIMDWYHAYVSHINSQDKQLVEFLKTKL